MREKRRPGGAGMGARSRRIEACSPGDPLREYTCFWGVPVSRRERRLDALLQPPNPDPSRNYLSHEIALQVLHDIHRFEPGRYSQHHDPRGTVICRFSTCPEAVATVISLGSTPHRDVLGVPAEV